MPTPPRNRALLRDYLGIMVVKRPLARPQFLGADGLVLELRKGANWRGFCVCLASLGAHQELVCLFFFLR